MSWLAFLGEICAKQSMYMFAAPTLRCNSLGFHLTLRQTAAFSAGMKCDAGNSVAGWGWDKAKAYS
jgi:hypothetical protein